VERCQGAGCTSFAQIATPASATFGDTGLTAHTTYRYRVRAVDAAGKLGPYSGISSTTTLSLPDTAPPTAPGTPTAKPSGKTKIHLKWLAATDNVGVTSYRVERCAGTVCNNFVEVDQPTHTNVHDTGLTASTTYRYRVRAVDAAGNLGPYSGISTATTKGHPPKGHPSHGHSSPGHDPDDRD
jgi:chitodextrinase